MHPGDKVATSEHRRNALKWMLENMGGSLNLSAPLRESVRVLAEEVLKAGINEGLGTSIYERGEPGI